MSKDNGAQINNSLNSAAGIGFKVGAAMVALALAFLLYTVFGPKLASMKTMSAADKNNLIQTIGWAKTLLRYGSILLVLGMCIRFFYEEVVGLIMTLVGAALYFFSPKAFSSLTLGALKQNQIYLGIVNDIAATGLICMVPGVLLLARDLVMRVVNGFGDKHVANASAAEGARVVKMRQHKLYEMCWDMACCNERAKRFCPSSKRHRPCWQLKSGCMCDETIIREAYRDQDRVLSNQKAADSRPKAALTAQQKKDRCRNCTIFMEHQRQKFKIVSPVTIVLVLVAYIALYGRISAVLYSLLKNMDRFMSFMTYHHNAASSFSSQGQTVTILATICLGVVLLSFTMKAVEYLVFELKV